MKQILPVQIWYQGQIINATIFGLNVINDNLTNNAKFYFVLYSGTVNEPVIKLSDGNLTMSGSDYTTYSSSPDSNDFAYSWAANKLGLTLV